MFEPMTARHCAVCKYICRYLQYDSLLLSIFLVKNFRGFGRPSPRGIIVFQGKSRANRVRALDGDPSNMHFIGVLSDPIILESA